MRAISLLLPLLILPLLGCPPEAEGEPPPVESDAWLLKIADCDELHDEVVDAWIETLVQSRYGYGWDTFEGDDAVPTNGDGPTSYSDTNVQEEGVDEPDMVETDGEYLYVLQGTDLTILDSWPAEETREVASLTLESAPWSMFLSGDRIVTFGWSHEVFPPGEEWRSNGGTRATLIDVSDRSAPTVLRTIDLDGWMADARRIGDDVYVVLDTWLGMPQGLWDLAWDESLGLPEADWEAEEDDQLALRAEAREILRPHVEAFAADVAAEDLLPRRIDSASEGVEPLMACNDLYKPRDNGEVSLLTVVHFDMTAGSVGGDVSATGLLSDGWTVYASQENLYVARSSWWWWWGWGDLDLTTNIHRFRLAGGETRYEASGEVPGWMLNSFSMGEYDGHLRVATTDQDWWWGTADGEADEPANNVFVLERDGSALNVVGEVRGIAPGERIYASRFLGDRGFLVTFLQIDPLFTLDLSDPRAPTVVGELEVPGYSAYLHPFEDDHLLAVGMDGDEDGTLTGFSMSLFDVSDFADPGLTDRLTVGSDWGWSESLWDHHAFTLHNSVLSVPAYWWDEAGGGFSGLLVVACSTSGLTELGRVDHADLVGLSECIHPWEDACVEDYWYAQVRRSVVIEDWLYSISDYGVKVTVQERPDDEVARVLFNPRDG
jgi:uncharacterized secreted protein with C-terminal beta-propeller domain